MFQIGAKGKISAEEMMQLAERGIPSWQLLADAMGLSVKEVMKLSEQGKLMASDALPKLIGGMEKSFGGSMAKQATTFNGLMATLNDTWKQVSAQMTKPLFERIKGQLPGLIKMVQQLPSILGSAGNALSEAFSHVPIVTLVQGFISGFTQSKGAVESLKNSFQSLAPGLTQLFQLLQSFFVFVGAVFGKLGSLLGQAFAALLPVITPALQAVLTFVQGIATQIQTFWTQNGEMILQATRNVFTGIQAIVSVVMPIVQFLIVSIWENVKGIVSGALNVILGLVKLFAGLFTGNFSAMWAGTKQLFSGAEEFIWNLMNLLFLGRILKGFKALVSGGLALIKSMWSGLRSAFTSWVNFVVGLVQARFPIISSVVKSVSQILKSVVTGNWSSIRSIVSISMSNVLGAIRSRWGSAVSYLRGINLYGIGRNIIQGLLNGLSSLMGAVVRKAQSIASTVKNTIKSALDIHSPSRVTFKLGAYVGQGLALGIEKSALMVSRAANGLAAAGIPDIRHSSSSPMPTSTQNNQYTFHVYGSNQPSEKLISNELQRLEWLYG
ncbi:tape measure protein [Laceyella tengchongensis]|uniref:tape measure protein n=1 Tax=Laceyella tengchongensis TaxID=574699 RepID=UPI002547DB34|nr:tape measure protein [Laceyella tengchongensis]